ncbi:MAG TPA: glutaminase [Sphingomicrobium sp.]|nr:glutaminase [Sphingomicrobium sp.]
MAHHKHRLDLQEVERVVGEITQELGSSDDRGEVTKQIEALSGVDSRQFGIAILTRDGDMVCGGDADTPFSIQSISKVFSLELVLEAHGDELWDRVGRDPSGDPFNSVIDLERQEGRPRNPFINAGALIVVDMLLDKLGPEKQVEAVVRFVEDLLDGDGFNLNDKVARSDEEAGNLNRAMLNIAKHFGNVRNDIGQIMKAYVLQCAIELSCRQLARVGRFLMLEGPDEAANRDLDAARRSRRILALMMTSGLYDGAGEFAYRVGLPAKSGIGGGILAIAPNTASIAVWSPGLDESGNSKLGTLALEMLTDRLDWSSFGKIKTL